MKPSNLITLTMALVFLMTNFVSVSFSASKTPFSTSVKQKSLRCAAPPATQVVNNSGIKIFQVKVGNTIFKNNLSRCSNGCSTGFKNVKPGKKQIYIKTVMAAPWKNIGVLGEFKGCKKYAVNIKKKGQMICAELFLRLNTDPTFNNDKTKKKIASICKSLSLKPAINKTAAHKKTTMRYAGQSGSGTSALSPSTMRLKIKKAKIEYVYFKKAVEGSSIMQAAPMALALGAGSSSSGTTPLIRAEFGELIVFNCQIITKNVQNLRVRLRYGNGSLSNLRPGDSEDLGNGKKKYIFQIRHRAQIDEILTLDITGTGVGLAGIARAEKQVEIETQSPDLESRMPAVNDETREVTFKVRNTGPANFHGAVRIQYLIMPANEILEERTLRFNNVEINTNTTLDIETITLPESALTHDNVQIELSVSGECYGIWLPESENSYSHTWETHTFTINETLLSLFNGMFSGYVRVNNFDGSRGGRSDSRPEIDDSRLSLTVQESGGPRTVFDRAIAIPAFKFGSTPTEALVLIKNLNATIGGRDLFFIEDGKLGLRIVFDTSANKEIEVWARDAVAHTWRDSWLPDMDLRSFSIELILTPTLNGQTISYSDLTMNANVNLEIPGHRIERYLEREAANEIEHSFAPVFDNAEVKSTIENTFSELVNNPLLNIRHIVSLRGTGNSIEITYR